jgi:two-component system NarL family sensor kinase
VQAVVRLPLLSRAAPPTSGAAARAIGLLALCATPVTCGIAAVGVITAADGWVYPVTGDLRVDLVIAITFPVAAAAMLLGRQPSRLGWLLLGMGTAAALNGLAVAAFVAGPSGVARPAAQLQGWLWVPAVVPLVTLVPLLYPDGRLPATGRGRRLWRWAARASWAGTALLAAGVAAHPGSVVGPTVVDKPLTSDVVAVPLVLAAVVLLLPGLVAGMAAVAVRLRGADPLQRRQVTVFVVAAVAVLADFIAQPLLPPPAAEISQMVAVATLPLAIGVAITRHRLYDLDLAVCRAVVAVSLVACLAGAYVVILAVLSVAPLPATTRVGLAAGFVGVTAYPLGRRLAGAVDRMFYGERENPYRISARLAGRLREGLDPADVPGVMCATIVEELRLGGAALAVGDESGVPAADRAVASVGAPDAPGRAQFPLWHRGRQVGVLTVAPRPGERSVPERDAKVLQVLADQAAPAVAALSLTAALRHSREALVAAREEERRRLRRDLHDGLGATLAGLRLHLDSLRDLVDDELCHKLLDTATGAILEAVADVRRISDDLRPPALDEVGLPGTLRALAARLDTPALAVDADTGDVGSLPAAVEVACYRIAAEALTNAARHAGARHVQLALEGDAEEVVLSVRDDGSGIGRKRSGGLGLESMRQRAEEIGGTLTITSAPTGTLVLARLPRGAT